MSGYAFTCLNVVLLFILQFTHTNCMLAEAVSGSRKHAWKINQLSHWKDFTKTTSKCNRDKSMLQKLNGNSEHSRLPVSLQTTENTSFVFILYSDLRLSPYSDLQACRKLLLFSRLGENKSTCSFRWRL